MLRRSSGTLADRTGSVWRPRSTPTTAFMTKKAKRERAVPDWAFLGTFSASHVLPTEIVPAWVPLLRLVDAEAAIAEADMTTVNRLLHESELALHACGLGLDPAHRDWREFRPLRVTREEDWSDWLAHLCLTARTAGVRSELLGFPVTADSTIEVLREESTDDRSRREDIVVVSGEVGATLEVKIWDSNLEKTHETALRVHAAFPAVKTWHDFILLPEESLDDWGKIPDSRVISSRTWDEVAIGLRRALLVTGDHAECVEWKAWGLAFCGAIEARILGLEVIGGGHSASARSIERRLAMLMEAAR